MEVIPEDDIDPVVVRFNFGFVRRSFERSPVLVPTEETVVNITLFDIELDPPPPPPPPGPLFDTGGFGSCTIIVTVIGPVVIVPSETV